MATVVIFIIAVIVSCGVVVTAGSNCHYFINMDKSYTIKKTYKAGYSCKWVVKSPFGYNSRVDCTLNLDKTTGCTIDRLLISNWGDPQLTTGADGYCGKRTVSVTSTGPQISVGLSATKTSRGGDIDCTVYAQPIKTPPSNCSCGYAKNKRIVGGRETLVNEFPSMVGILKYRTVIFCGGVIISDRFVLTAAHCMARRENKETAVVVGEHDITKAHESPATKIYEIDRVLMHPKYLEYNYDYDVALIITTTKIKFSGLVGPICLPFKYTNADLEGLKLQALGWGSIFVGGPVSDYLRKVTLDVIPQSKCKVQVTDRQVCTYTPKKDSCHYDSGGPLIHTDPATGLMFNLGIISYGTGCADTQTPSINVRVTNSDILQWIVNSTPKVNHCFK